MLFFNYQDESFLLNWTSVQNRTDIQKKQNEIIIQYQLIITQTSRINKMNNQKQTTHQLNEQEKCQMLSQFFDKNKPDLLKDMTLDQIKATIVSSDPKYLPFLGSKIRNGQLVAFPTETVYGLGADATNEKALLQIYRVKRRPLTDPIIVHVLGLEEALKLVVPQSEQEIQLLTKLTNKYWPGPLTIILKANLDILPKVVTAQTGFVGLRSPKCQYARHLIKQSQRPIGAPSANLFSHVSPTSAVHVLNDFYDQEVTIVDGERCEYGIQSTVVKIVNRNIQILRQGSLSRNKLEQFLTSQFGQNIKVTLKKRVQKQEQNKNMEAPGQLLKHYAPYLPCYSTSIKSLASLKDGRLTTEVGEYVLSQSTLISFSKDFDEYQNRFKYYLPCSQFEETNNEIVQLEEDEEKFCTLQEKRKMGSLYHLLRKAENLDTKLILIGWNQEKQGTLWDKIFRATQGNEVPIA